MQETLRKVLIVGLCAVPAIPLIVADGFFFPFITGKNFAFRILVEALFAVWVILAISDTSLRPKLGGKRWYLLPLMILGLLVSAGISAALAENQQKAFWSNFERMEGWIGLAHATAYFFVLWATLQSDKLWSRFWNTSIVVSVVIGLYGLMQLGGMFPINQGGVRVDGTLGNATYLAVYMLFHVFITIFYLVKKWTADTALRYWYIGAALLQAVILLYTATRGTILGLAGGLFLTALCLLFFSKGAPAMKKWAAGILVVLVAAAGLLYMVRDVPAVKNHEILSRISGITLEDGKVRFTIWGMALEGFKERPVFGWGQEGFNYVFNKYYEPSLYAQEPWFDRAHNAFIDWLIAGGIIGFAMYISFYILPLWYLWRPGSDFSVFEKSTLTGLLAAYGFHNMFVFDNLVSYFFFMSTLAYILYRRQEAEELQQGVPKAIQPIVASVVVIGMTAVFWFANVPGIATATNLINGLKPQCVDSAGASIACNTPGATQDLTVNFEYMKKADTGGLGRQEVAEQTVQFASQIQTLTSVPVAFKSEVANYAANRMQQEIERTPNDARLVLFLGSFLRQMGDLENARAYIARAAELSPRKQQVYLEMAFIDTAANNHSAAFAWFKKAFEFAPAYELARTFYAAAAIRAGQLEFADSLLTEGFGTVTPDNDIVLQAYLDTEQYARIVGIAEAKIDKNPNDANLRIQAAAAYLAAGLRAEAIRELEKAIELEPAFREQGTYYINEIKAGRNP